MNLKNKFQISIIAFLAAFILMLVFVVFPLFGDIRDNSRELAMSRKKFGDLEAEIENIERFKVIYEGLEQFLGKVDNLFVDEEVPVDFITFFESTAQESKIAIDIHPTSEGRSKGDPWDSLSFQISCRGTFPDFMAFVEKLENSPYLIEMKNIIISKKSAKEATLPGEIEASFTLKAYHD
jgi:Tfp pilus assembly protein PilO